MPNKLVLYIGSTCRFCHKVLDFAQKRGIELEIKDVWSHDDYFKELEDLMGKTQVPCLVVDGKGILESDVIIKKLDELFPH